jgi:hypothetical protein
MKDGGIGSLMQTLPESYQKLPNSPVPTGSLLLLMISTLKPGAGFVALPAFGGNVCKFL